MLKNSPTRGGAIDMQLYFELRRYRVLRMHSCHAIVYGACMHPLGACVIANDYCVGIFIYSSFSPHHFHQSSNSLL